MWRHISNEKTSLNIYCHSYSPLVWCWAEGSKNTLRTVKIKWALHLWFIAGRLKQTHNNIYLKDILAKNKAKLRLYLKISVKCRKKVCAWVFLVNETESSNDFVIKCKDTMYCMAVRRPMELISFFVNWRKMSVYSDLIGCRKTRRPVKYERVYKQTSITEGDFLRWAIMNT